MAKAANLPVAVDFFRRSCDMCETLSSRISFLILALAIGLTCSGIVEAQLPEPIGLWRFEEGEGTTTADVGTGRNPGTLMGDVVFVKDPQRGTVLEFGTGASYVETHAWVTELATASFSMSAWIQTTEQGVAIVGKCNEDRTWQFHEKQFYLSNGTEQGQPVAGGVHFYGNQGGEIWGKTPVHDGMWHHVCVTWNYATKAQHIYVDGVLDDLRPVWVYYGGRGDNLTDTVKIGFDCAGDAISDFIGRMDDVAIFNVELTPGQVVELMHLAWPVTASNPTPYDGMTDLPRQTVVLRWNPGMYARTHDVYFGAGYDDVQNAGRTNPLNVLLVQDQAEDHYPVDGALDLDLGTTYYWRIDEVNGAPDYAIHKGEVWQFTTEPLAYPVDGRTITATASSAAEGQGPENTVNSAGLANDLHSDALTAMWLTASGAAGPAWIEFEFDTTLKLHEMWVWNHNGRLEPAIGYGAKAVSIDYSTNGIDYMPLETTQFARATGKPNYAPNTIIDLGGIVAKHVKLTISSNWGGLLPQYGLSEVRFFSVPVYAREPNPASGQTAVAVDTTLSWRAGREAAKHNVYVGTDQQDVIDGVSPVATVTGASYSPALTLGTDYFWKVVEVNETQVPAAWHGPVWSFSTAEYLVVDDFERYTNDLEAGGAIFQTWVDGWGVATNGSLVGYETAPFAERVIVSSGRQSMPLAYDNTSAMYSETARTFAGPQNWSRYGIKGLTLRFYGNADNAAQQMYVKINNTKISYTGDSTNLKLAQWQTWHIDLTTRSVSNVASLTIGLERLGNTGGKGMVFLDDIRLDSKAQ
jgi:hypothetical protein